MVEASKTTGSEPELQPVSEPADELSKEPTIQRSGLYSALRALWWKFYWLAPNTIPNPYGDDTAYLKQRETSSNVETRVPTSEHFRSLAIWGMELFGPSEIDRLYDALEKLGWRRRFSADETEVTDWVQSQRSYGHGGGWYNVGLIVRPKDRTTFSIGANFAQLPDEVEHAWVQIK
jgi:hypothetical protein